MKPWPRRCLPGSEGARRVPGRRSSAPRRRPGPPTERGPIREGSRQTDILTELLTQDTRRHLRLPRVRRNNSCTLGDGLSSPSSEQRRSRFRSRSASGSQTARAQLRAGTDRPRRRPADVGSVIRTDQRTLTHGARSLHEGDGGVGCHRYSGAGGAEPLAMGGPDVVQVDRQYVGGRTAGDHQPGLRRHQPGLRRPARVSQ